MVPHGCFSCVVLGAGRRLTLLARRQFWDCRCSINDRCFAVERLALRWLSGKEPLLLLTRRIQKLAGKRKSSGQLKRIAAMIDLSGGNLVRANINCRFGPPAGASPGWPESSSEEGQAGLEQPFHIADMLLVDEEENDVIAGLDHCAVVGNQHLFVANHRADGGT